MDFYNTFTATREQLFSLISFNKKALTAIFIIYDVKKKTTRYPNQGMNM